MNPDASIQHKPQTIAPTGCGFEGGAVVPVVMPPDDESPESEFEKGRAVGREETLHLLFALLLKDNTKQRDIVAKVHLLAFGAGLHPAMPETQSQLAGVMGVSEGTVTNLKTKLSKTSNEIAGFIASR